jgi:basic membrane protein A
MTAQHYGVILLAATLTITGSLLPARGAETTVSALFTQKVTEGNFDPPGYLGFTTMAKTHGWKSNYAEHATFDKAPEILADFASRGSNLIICHSSGYASSVLETAPNFPKTTFSVVSSLASTKGLPNVNGWAFRFPEIGFLAGVAAGLSTKTGKVGVIGGDTVPAIVQGVGGYIQGVKHVNPNAEVIVSWVGSFVDTAKAKQLAMAQISQGADVILPWANTADQGIFEAVKERKVATVGLYGDLQARAPNEIITSVVLDFPSVYAEIGRLYAAGKLEPKVYPLVVKDGFIKLAPIRNSPPEVEKKILAVVDDIKSGKLIIPDPTYKP